MPKLRAKTRLHRPPPMYKPLGAWITVVVHYGGKFVSSPVAKYVGGECIKLDYVVTRQLNLESLHNSIQEWLLLDEVFRIYIIQNGIFKLLKFDDEVIEYGRESLQLREVVFYVDDKNEMMDMNLGNVEGRIETDGNVEQMNDGNVESMT